METHRTLRDENRPAGTGGVLTPRSLFQVPSRSTGRSAAGFSKTVPDGFSHQALEQSIEDATSDFRVNRPGERAR